MLEGSQCQREVCMSSALSKAASTQRQEKKQLMVPQAVIARGTVAVKTAVAAAVDTEMMKLKAATAPAIEAAVKPWHV